MSGVESTNLLVLGLILLTAMVPALGLRRRVRAETRHS